MTKRAWWAGKDKSATHKFSAKPVIVTADLQVIEKATVLAAADARGIARTLPPTLRRRAEKVIRLVDLAAMVGIDGQYFPSKKEGSRYVELRRAAQAGVVWDLKRQPRFKLHTTNPEGLKVCITEYTADYEYWEKLAPDMAAVRLFGEQAGEQHVVEECKGFPTPDWELRRKWVEAEYGIVIRVT